MASQPRPRPAPTLACLQRLAKPPGPVRRRAEWSQASVAALLAVQRACGWLDAASGLELEGGEVEEEGRAAGRRETEDLSDSESEGEGSDLEGSSDDDWAD